MKILTTGVIILQKCAAGYDRDVSGQCVLCACNKHSDRCDATSGVCVVMRYLYIKFIYCFETIL